MTIATDSQRPGEDDEYCTGLRLVELARNEWSRFERSMLDHKRSIIDRCFAVGGGTPIFRSNHIEALRIALRSAYFGMARVLLDKDDAHDLLTGEVDILQAAISSQCTWNLRWSCESYELVEMLELLVSHGASVNTVDSKGNTPLYYCCAHGHIGMFKFLVDSGADYKTVYDPLPNSDIDMPESNHIVPTEEPRKVNLLDIALEANIEREKGCSVPWIRSHPLQRKWGDIIMFLLGAGLSFRTDDPRLAKFFQLACFQGNLPYVEKLLAIGVDQTARPARGDKRDEVDGSCLHAAVRAGQREVVACLLSHGAVASTERLCTHDFRTSLQPMTPIVRAFDIRLGQMPNSRSIVDVFHCCELLVKARASDYDCRVLLENSVKQENTELTWRLLSQGVRLNQVPQTKSLEVVKLLLTTGAELDSASLQRYAVSVGKVELLRFLVERDGPFLQLRDFGHIGFELMRGKDTCFMDTLQYLVTDYGYDINATFPGHPNADYRVNFLQRACEERNVAAVQLLLEHGADPECPGLQKSAIACVKSRGSGGEDIISSFSQREMPILQALIKYGDIEVQSSVAESIRQHKSRPSFDKSMDLADTTTSSASHANMTDHQRLATTQTPAEQPSIDNCTEAIPWVEETATRFRYDRLERDDAIRLLVLEPSDSPEDPIRCRLVEATHREKPEYEVLSCDWPNMVEAETVPICLNGATFDTPLAVWDALRRTRLSDQDRFLWVDAVCINRGRIEKVQDSDEQDVYHDDWIVRERNQQVSHFRDIYQGAARALVWLGKTADYSNLVFEHLEKCRGHSHLNWCQYRGATEVAFRKLCQRPWFYSAWTAQELALSKKTVIMCGRYETEWPELMKCTCFLSDADYYHPLEGVDGRTHLKHLQGLSREYGMSLRQAVLCNRHCKADDPRDKVYGMMSLEIDSQLCVPIDYGASVVQVFRDFTQRVIESSQDLEILHWFGPQKLVGDGLYGLPSWVPNFNTPDLAGALPGIFDSRSFSVNYPCKLLPGVRFPSQCSIAIKGRPIERASLLGKELRATEATKAGSAQFSSVLRNWESIAGQLADTKRFPQAVTDAFSDTIVGNDQHDLVIESDTRPFVRKTRPRLSAKADGFDLWYAKYGTGVLRQADPDYFDEIATIKAWLEVGREPISEAEQKRRKEQKGYFLRSYAHKMEMTCYGRKFFTTDRGSMGLAPPRTLPGDEIVFLPGGKYPFILRPKDDDAYEMIGDCFLYDFDVFALFQDERTETREFVIA